MNPAAQKAGIQQPRHFDSIDAVYSSIPTGANRCQSLAFLSKMKGMIWGQYDDPMTRFGVLLYFSGCRDSDHHAPTHDLGGGKFTAVMGEGRMSAIVVNGQSFGLPVHPPPEETGLADWLALTRPA
ncbi:hypothetical protein ACFPTO_10245 [Paraburkholderia denitrificans]|uniref:Uncharacterized protein n=1 Tax=Paraburkholderia denitrificans TaxID=694025 RepID=A0ABW0J7Y4_9BURK